MQKYAFIDRDGTLIWEPACPAGTDPRETFPLKSMSEFRFLEGAIDGLKQLAAEGYELVMVTNQTFLGTPKHPREMFDRVMAKIDEELAKHGLRFVFKMICPHGPDDGCECRKPKLGGLKIGKIDLERSIMFGNGKSDAGFAANLGVRFVKIPTNGRFSIPSIDSDRRSPPPQHQ